MKESATVIGSVLLTVVFLAALIFGVDILYDRAIAEESPAVMKQNTKIKTIPAKTYFVDGFDWSLPPNTSKEKNADLIDEHNYGLDSAQTVFIQIRWDEANPAYQRYDFSKFEKALNDVKPKRILVRLEVNSFCEAPKWALRKLRSSKDRSLIFWDKQYLDLLKPFVEAFAKRYAANPRIVGVQLGIGDGEYKNSCDDYDDKDGWGEFWMSPSELAEAEKQFGLTPDLFEKRSKQIIDIYAAAFAGNLGKLAYTNFGPLYSWDEIGKPYNKKLKVLADYSLQKGLGNRDGAIERWMSYIDPVYGTYLKSLPDGRCRLVFDEAYAEKIRGRYWGTENEFYGTHEYVLEEHGPYQNQPYRFLISSLRSLQMRRNYVMIGGKDQAEMHHPVYKIQDLLHYLSKVQGKQIENTPDVFVLLGERYIDKWRVKSFANEPCVKNNEKVVVRSFGRWLTESGNSIPAIRIDMPKSEKNWGQGYYLPEGINYEYFARRSRQFSFDINDKLTRLRCNNGCNAVIKITFKDSTKGSLRLRVAEGQTMPFKTQGDNKIKTLSFNVKSNFKNALKGKDFMLINKDGTLPVIMVRVNLPLAGK